MAVNATAVWRVRPSGSNTNGGGYDSGIAGAGTDYSQQNTAQATGTLGTAAGTTAFSDAGGAFTAVMIGNALWIASGAGFTAGVYFITGYTSATAITLDRSPGTGTVAHWALGGAWADFFTNTTANIVAGNVVYLLGGGTAINTASYTYDYTASTNYAFVNGSLSAGGYVTFSADPNTPGTGLVVIQTNGTLVYGTFGLRFVNCYLVTSSAANATYGIFYGSTAANAAPNILINCVYDQFGYDIGLNGQPARTAGSPLLCFGCEMFSSVTPGGGGSDYMISGAKGTLGNGCMLIGCNIHDTVGPGLYLGPGMPMQVIDTVIAKCRGVAIYIPDPVSSLGFVLLKNVTIDANNTNGIEVATQLALTQLVAINLIISNNTGGTGIIMDAGTAATNNPAKAFIDYNALYNNGTNYSAIGAGAHDTALGSNPYVGQSTENYTLA